MAISSAIKRAVRSVLESRGYWTRHRSVLPYGIDYQYDIVRLSKSFGKSIKVFFDIGANVGQTSSTALVCFPEATVYAFEPDKSSFSALSAAPRSPRFRAFNIALSDRTGEASFFDYGTNATSNSLTQDSQYASRVHLAATVRKVECQTLDDFCATAGVDQIDVLKVDTEGHDLAVLQGAARMLGEQRVQFVYVEFNTLLPKPGSSGGALLPMSELLESAGFRFVASYPEYMITSGDLFVTSNALFIHQ